MNREFTYINRGIYSLAEASRLTGVPARSLRRWIAGSHGAAVFTSDFARSQPSQSISFLDMIESLFLKKFRDHGVSWRAIRIAAQNAARALDTPHPFASHRFFTDGKAILRRTASDSQDVSLVNLVSSQYEMDDVVSPALYGNIDFGELDLASRWWPQGRSAGIVVDPTRSMGMPVVAASSIPTYVLNQQFSAVGSYETVASWFEIEPAEVEAAVRYESALAA